MITPFASFLKMIAMVLICSISAVFGADTDNPCSDLSGTWQNQAGEYITIIQHPSNRIGGLLFTDVPELEDANYNAGYNLLGSYFTTPTGSLIAFNVMYFAGVSPISWVGECLSCDGEEKLYTTWVWKLYDQSPFERYLNTRVNEDTFFRFQGPPPANGGISDENTSPIKFADFANPWSSKLGGSIQSTHSFRNGDAWNGIRSTSDGVNEIYAQIMGNETFAAVGFVETLSNVARGWAGHIGNPLDFQKSLDTTWLEHGLSNDCADPRKFVRYGNNLFVQDFPTGIVV